MDLPIQEAIIMNSDINNPTQATQNPNLIPTPKKSFPWIPAIFSLLFAATLAAGTFFFFRAQSLQQQLTVSPSPISSPTPSPSLDPTSSWQTYTNQTYGFELKYPAPFKVLTDKDNLYGWPQAVVLIYSGGQSYDLPIEVWDTESQYKQKYPKPGLLTVYKTGSGKFITLTNANNDPKVTAIIATFRFTNQ